MSESNSATSRSAAPTLHDVAREADVSLATASRVLNGSDRKVAEPYRARVTAAASRLGYTANLSAQATARGRTNVVTLLVADIADPYFGHIAAGVTRRAGESELLVTIAVSGRDVMREIAQVRVARGNRSRVIILATSRMGDVLSPEMTSEIAAFAASGGQVVAFGPGAETLPSVLIDNHGGARDLARTLGQRGYREAVVLAADHGIRTSDARVEGFIEGFADVGGQVAEVRRGPFTRAAGEEAIRSMLSTGRISPGTVVFAVSDVVALGAMAGVRASGRAVGADVAVAGFDDIESASDVTPGLTTVRVPLEEMGYRALGMALGDDAASRPAGLRVVVRDSTPAR